MGRCKPAAKAKNTAAKRLWPSSMFEARAEEEEEEEEEAGEGLTETEHPFGSCVSVGSSLCSLEEAGEGLPETEQQIYDAIPDL